MASNTGVTPKSWWCLRDPVPALCHCPVLSPLIGILNTGPRLRDVPLLPGPASGKMGRALGSLANALNKCHRALRKDWAESESDWLYPRGLSGGGIPPASCLRQIFKTLQEGRSRFEHFGARRQDLPEFSGVDLGAQVGLEKPLSTRDLASSFLGCSEQ